MKAILDIKKWAHNVASQTLIGDLVLRLKPSIKREFVLLFIVFFGGYIGYKVDIAMLPFNEYGKAVTVGYFMLLGYAIRFVQTNIIHYLWRKENRSNYGN